MSEVLYLYLMATKINLKSRYRSAFADALICFPVSLQNSQHTGLYKSLPKSIICLDFIKLSFMVG